MKIEVGIFGHSGNKKSAHTYGWEIVCEQEKIPHKITDKPECPVIVCEGETPYWFMEFMESGGIGIVTDCEPDSLPFPIDFAFEAVIEYIDLSDLDSSKTRVSCIGKIFNGIGSGKISVHEKRITKSGIIQDEFPVFIFQRYGNGGCWYSGLPLTKLLTVVGDTLREFELLDGFSERAAAIDKHNIIRALRNILIRSFNFRGLPYVHLWYYPKKYQSVFTFRVDVDGAFGRNLKFISDAAISNGFVITFFINKSLCENEAPLIFEIDQRHEIGNHADSHNLYTDYSSNINNINNCKKWLDQMGINHGMWFVAPRGMWNFSLHKALEALGYLYTSDFGCAVAGFPFYPFLSGSRSKTLQIPVNPFAAERASIWVDQVDRKDSDVEFVKYSFSRIIEDCYCQNYPIMLYSHTEKFGSMADTIFQQFKNDLRDLNVWITTVSKFAEWWNHRDSYIYEAEYDPHTKELMVSGNLDPEIIVKEIYL